VLKEERQLLTYLSQKIAGTDYGLLYSEYEQCENEQDVIQFVNKYSRGIKFEDIDEFIAELTTVISRKLSLHEHIENERKEDFMSLLDFMEDGQVEIFGNVHSFD